MAEKKLVEAITSMDVDFAQWYTDVVKKAELVDYTALCGNHDHRLGGNLTDFTAYLPSVLILGKHDVKKDKIRLVQLEIAETFDAVVCSLNLVAFLFKIKGQEITDIHIIFDNQ